LRRGGFSNRGSTGGFGDRGGSFFLIIKQCFKYIFFPGRGGFNDRNVGRNNEENNENSSQTSGGFSSK
jgi:hypothetical protein